MKRVIKYILLLSAILFLFGCSKEEKQTVERPHPDDVIIDNINYKLDYHEEEYNIKYRVAKNFKKTVLKNSINYFSDNKNKESNFVIRVLYYPSKDINYAIKDSVTNYDKKYEKTINNKKYIVVHFKNSEKEETNIYYYTHGKNTYAFAFTFKEDISLLENKFLQRVEY